MSKAGLAGFTKCMATEMGSRGVRINLVEPGFILTDMTIDLHEERKKSILHNIPLNRFGTPEDVASMVSFLASDASRYVTGQTFRVDGGLSIARK